MGCAFRFPLLYSHVIYRRFGFFSCVLILRCFLSLFLAFFFRVFISYPILPERTSGNVLPDSIMDFLAWCVCLAYPVVVLLTFVYLLCPDSPVWSHGSTFSRWIRQLFTPFFSRVTHRHIAFHILLSIHSPPSPLLINIIHKHFFVP